MSPTISAVITTCLIVFWAETLVEGVRTRRWARMLLLWFFDVVVFVVLHWLTGYPASRIAFGGGPSTAYIVLMFVCILIGMGAQYLFYLRRVFSIRAFLRPLLVSPLILLPLLGTIQEDAALRPIQVISLAILAFQNGFFWRTVFEKAKP